ncbi:MAG: PAS domain S-box protein [Candidatus Riflebacteria bacterium]|nr:PAS domain S-box protein [Candidatus Riflebacteria bacterium]
MKNNNDLMKIRTQAEAMLKSRSLEPMDCIESLKPDEVRQLLYNLRVHQIELELQNDELLKTQEDLESTKKRYFNLYDLAPVGYVTLNERGIILEANLAAANMLGVVRSVLIKQSVLKFIIHADHDNFYLNCRRLLETEFKVSFALRMFNGNSEEFWAHVEITKILRDNEICFLTSFFDITEKVKAKEELEKSLIQARELAVQAESANKAKSDFLAIMSHEIRNPMFVVLGMSDALLDEDLTIQQRRYAEILRSSADGLLSIVNDILDYSRIGAKKLELEKLDFDLHTTVKNIAEIFSIRAREKNLELNCMIDSEVPVLLNGDPARLRQIVNNLVGNAIKFTQKGEIRIQVKLLEESEKDAFIRFSVSDTGIGIPQNRLSEIFSPFVQGDTSASRKYGGSGLGLAISRELAEMMGGRIGANSRENFGSEFWFTALISKQNYKSLE